MGHSQQPDELRRMHTQPARWPLRRLVLFGILLLPVAIITGFVYRAATYTEDSPFEPLPDPNGYEIVMAAARSIPREKLDEYETRFHDAFISQDHEWTPRHLFPEDGETDGPKPMTVARLTRYLDSLTEVWERVDRGLSLECRVPIEVVEGTAQRRDNMLALIQLRGLFYAYELRSYLLECEGRYREASEVCLKLIDLARTMRRGGLWIDFLVTQAGVEIGLNSLRRLVPKLSSAEIAKCRKALRGYLQNMGCLEDVNRRERFWVRTNATLFQRVYLFRRVETALRRLGLDSSIESISRNHQVRVRLTIIELSLEHYRRSVGRLPSALEDLVPEHLLEIPEDPFRDDKIVYRPSDDGYLLYSVGADGIDDGGVPLDSDDVALDPTGPPLSPERARKLEAAQGE